MWYDGIKFSRVKHLGWRLGNPDTDVDSDGEPVSSNYIIIVSVKDCRMYEKGARKYYDASQAVQHVRLAYSSNNMGYGKSRKYQSYFTTPVYLVYDGLVYQGRLRHSEAG